MCGDDDDNDDACVVCLRVCVRVCVGVCARLLPPGSRQRAASMLRADCFRCMSGLSPGSMLAYGPDVSDSVCVRLIF